MCTLYSLGFLRYVDKRPLMAHQMYDTHLRTWYTGTKSRLYTAEILKPSEFSGTRINAPKRVPVVPARTDADKRSATAPEFASRTRERSSRHKMSIPGSKEGYKPSNASKDSKLKSDHMKLPQTNVPVVKHEPYLEKTHSLRDDPSTYWPPAKTLLTGKHGFAPGDNWISRKPASILEQLGVGTLQR